jgi:hypothetical protein
MQPRKQKKASDERATKDVGWVVETLCDFETNTIWNALQRAHLEDNYQAMGELAAAIVLKQDSINIEDSNDAYNDQLDEEGLYYGN